MKTQKLILTKTVSLLTLFLMVISLSANAQTKSNTTQNEKSGIYFTANDYETNNLSFAIDCKTEKHKIKSDMIFQPKEITIKHNNINHTFPKDTIYGILNCGGAIVRIYKNSEYPLINPNEKIMIFKVKSMGYGKNNPPQTKYYFSKDVKSEIETLSIDNLKKAFPSNHKFHDLIDAEFHQDKELYAYDDFHKIMKINRVLQNSLETK